jgi:predicted permease
MLPLFLQACRSWQNAKGVALLAATALAVGIGSATAIYAVVNGVVLKPLPYAHGDRFAVLYGARFSEPGQRSASTYPDMMAYQERTHSFDVFGCFRMNHYNLSSPGQPQYLNGVELAPALASNLGVNPVLGRWFRNPANEPGGYSVAVISNALWKRIGGTPDLLGGGLTLDGRTYTIIGVMPAWFRLPVGGPGVSARTDVWIPLDPRVAMQDKVSGLYFAYARLKPGVTFGAAEADVKAVAAQIAKEDPQAHPSYTARLDNIRDAVVFEIRPALLLLLGAASLLLLITSANVSGLLVARTVGRARETAVRVALGASKGQLVLQYFSEGLLVSLFGASAGVLLSLALVRSVIAIAGDYIPRSDEIGIDWTVLLFAVAVACATNILASFAPLWQALRTPPSEVLSDGARASASARSRNISRFLVIAEVALAFTLLTLSATLVIQLDALLRTRPGFDPNHLLTFQVSVGEAEYPDAKKLAPYQARLLEAVQSVPGVRHAAFVNQLPLDGCCLSTTIFPDGRTIDAGAVQRVSYLVASPDYLAAMRIPLVKGRFLTERDTNENPVAVAINQAAADFYWPGRDPVGSYGHFGGNDGSRFQVVGVIGNTKNDKLGDPTVPEIYISNAIYAVRKMHFMVRSPVPQAVLVPEVRAAIQRVSSSQPIHDVQMMTDVAQGSLAVERLSSMMTGFFAFAALLMTTLGVYGLVAYSVRQRTVEIGTRMALGAVGRDLIGLVVGNGLKIAGVGVAVGLAAAAAATWVLMSSFGVHEFAVRAFVYAAGIVAVVAGCASFFPAWRATLLSPMVAIRNEPRSMWRSTRRHLARAAHEASRLFTDEHHHLAGAEAGLPSQFCDAVHGADSFSEAVNTALATLCERVRCDSAFLLENVSGREFRPVAQCPDSSRLDFSLPVNGFLHNRLKFYRWPLTLTQDDFDAWLRWAAEQKPQQLPELQILRQIEARLAVPLRTQKEVTGLLLLGAPHPGGTYNEAAKRVLRVCANQFELMLENARLTERIIEQERLRRDLALAAEVQKRLLPEQSPEMEIGALAAISVPARTVGGDYYDFFNVGNRRIAVAIADVAGKGVAAALIASIVHASLRIISADGNISLPELAARMNHYLYRSTRSSSYATFFYAQIDEKTRQLHYVNAGHNPPYLIRQIAAAGETEAPQITELSIGGTIIGMFPKTDYEAATINLQPGDALVVFTDGVPEALNRNEEEFGEDRLKELLRGVANLPADQMSSRIADEVKSWIGEAPQYDDLTCVVMKVAS